jgi:hypothetical protein
MPRTKSRVKTRSKTHQKKAFAQRKRKNKLARASPKSRVDLFAVLGEPGQPAPAAAAPATK